MNFNDFYWHDSVMKSIYIDRTNPGDNDIVTLHIDWYDKPQSSIVFRDVFQLNARMNFGVIAPASIDDGYMEADDCEDIKTFRKKWNGLNDNIILHCYVIKTSSTGSELRIIAQSFEEIL